VSCQLARAQSTSALLRRSPRFPAHAFVSPILSAWRPEFGSWMIEATPGIPYGGSTADLLAVERNMAVRRWRISAALPPGCLPISLPCFPLLGVGAPGSFTSPHAPALTPFSHSAYLSDAIISVHPRFGALTANIRRRRGERVDIRIPLFRDGATRADSNEEGMIEANAGSWPSSLPDSTRATERVLAAAAAASANAEEDADLPARDPLPDHIHMDAMAFGMGCCCLQVTFQARDLEESRVLYDQLAVLAPLLLALTANTCIFRGLLADVDTRWDTISGSVDCRTPAERGEAGTPAPGWQRASPEAAAGGGARRLFKSRYSSVDLFITTTCRWRSTKSPLLAFGRPAWTSGCRATSRASSRATRS
jgi:glutamate--cysteine ligase catalytic subunit